MKPDGNSGRRRETMATVSQRHLWRAPAAHVFATREPYVSCGARHWFVRSDIRVSFLPIELRGMHILVTTFGMVRAAHLIKGFPHAYSFNPSFSFSRSSIGGCSSSCRGQRRKIFIFAPRRIVDIAAHASGQRYPAPRTWRAAAIAQRFGLRRTRHAGGVSQRHRYLAAELLGASRDDCQLVRARVGLSWNRCSALSVAWAKLFRFECDTRRLARRDALHRNHAIGPRSGRNSPGEGQWPSGGFSCLTRRARRTTPSD